MGQWRRSASLASAAAADMGQSPKFRSTPDDLGHAGYFLDVILKAQSMKEIIDNSDFIKSKRFWSETNNGKRVKKQAKEWEKYFQKTQLIKDKFKIHKTP